MDAPSGAPNAEAGDSAEAVIESVLSDIDLETVGDVEAFDASASESLQDAAARLAEVLETLEEVVDADEEGASAEKSHVKFVGEGLFAIREDGLYLSNDMGGSWSLVLDRPVYDLASTGFGLVVASTDGVWVSRDGRSWENPVDGSEGVEFKELLGFDDGSLLGLSESGLWASDGFTWTHRSPQSGSALFAHGGASGEVAQIVLGTPKELLSSWDGGVSFQPFPGSSLREVNQVEWISSEHWLLSSADGIWQTFDGGATFEPFSGGLPDTQVNDLVVMDGVVLAATPGGIVELRPPSTLRDQEGIAGILKRTEEEIPKLEQLVGSSVARQGVNISSRTSALRRLLPMVNLNGRYAALDRSRDDSGLNLDDPALDRAAGTLRSVRRSWRVGVELRWSPSGRKRGVFGSAYGDVAGADLGLDLGALQAVSEASSGRGYERDLVERVVTLFKARRRAIQRRQEIWRAPLLERVLVELRVREIEGELDALTDGGVSAWRMASREPEEVR